MEPIDIIILVSLVVGFAIGKLHTYYRLSNLLREVAKEQGIDLESEINKLTKEDTTPNVYKLEVEVHGDTLYLFDKETDNFICQGSSVQELAELAKKYKNVLYAAVKYDDKVFAFKDGKSTEVIA